MKSCVKLYTIVWSLGKTGKRVYLTKKSWIWKLHHFVLWGRPWALKTTEQPKSCLFLKRSAYRKNTGGRCISTWQWTKKNSPVKRWKNQKKTKKSEPGKKVNKWGSLDDWLWCLFDLSMFLFFIFLTMCPPVLLKSRFVIRDPALTFHCWLVH